MQPLFLSRTGKTSQIRLKAAIKSLHLTIRLRVVSRTHPKLRALQSEVFGPQLAGEHLISIRNNGTGHSK